MSQITAHNSVLFGVSADSVASHKGFHDKYMLNFDLLADPDKTMIKNYEDLSAAGYANRTTFVIAPNGTIESIDRAVNEQFYSADGTFKTHHGEQLALALSNWNVEMGGPVPNFSLVGVGGKTVSAYAPGTKATVVLFASPQAEYAAQMAAVASISTSDSYSKVHLLVLDPVKGDTIEQLDSWLQRTGIKADAALDKGAVLAKRFGVTAVPEVWLLSSARVAIYRGSVARAGTHTLQQVLDDLLAGKKTVITVGIPEGRKLVNGRLKEAVNPNVQ